MDNLNILLNITILIFSILNAYTQFGCDNTNAGAGWLVAATGAFNVIILSLKCKSLKK